MPTAPNEETGSEDRSTLSETLGCKSPDTHHTRCIRTKESKPLTEATLVKCLKQFVSKIRKEFKNALTNEKDRHHMSEPLIQNDVV